MQSVEILAAGMITGVGLNVATSCAAIRSGIDNFSETPFTDRNGEWIVGSRVPWAPPRHGLKKLAYMVVPAIKECLASGRNLELKAIPLLLCVAEKDRPGRLEELDSRLLTEIESALRVRFSPASRLISLGRVGGAVAIGMARRLIYQERAPLCLIAGVDSFLVGETLVAFEERDRILTSRNLNGFIPGEAAAAILVGPPQNTVGLKLLCQGFGSGREQSTIYSKEPLRADGLVQAIRSAFADAQRGFEDVDYRLTDANGEQYWFKEASLAVTRTMRIRKKSFSLLHPADCIGETGAAAVPCIFGVALTAAKKNYAPGPGVLCHFASDAGERVAIILRQIQVTRS
jgi:3-oxoacyl-[acyl-carrier-protein] synthase I